MLRIWILLLAVVLLSACKSQPVDSHLEEPVYVPQGDHWTNQDIRILENKNTIVGVDEFQKTDESCPPRNREPEDSPSFEVGLAWDASEQRRMRLYNQTRCQRIRPAHH